MEISYLDASTRSLEGITLPIRDPRVRRDYESAEDTRPFLREDDNDPKSPVVSIDIYGPDHPIVNRLMAPQRARYMQQALMSNTRKGAKITPEEIAAEEEENLNIAVAATRGWSGFKNNGEPWPCTAENARHLYTINKDIMEQVLSALRDRVSFLIGSKIN